MVFALGCGGDDDPIEVPPIALDPGAASVFPGGQVQFTAIATFADGTVRELDGVTWASSDVLVATIDADGLATGVATGTATITATKDGSTGVGGVTVLPAHPVEIQVTPPTASALPGLTQQFRATLIHEDGRTDDVTADATWTSSDEETATVDAAGEVTAIAPGEVTITATIDELSGEATFEVTSPPFTSIEITPINPTVGLCADPPLAFTAIALFGDGSTVDITDSAAWSVADAGIATIDAQGVVTPVGPGTTEVSASFAGETFTTLLTVLSGEASALVIDPAAATLAVGATISLAAIVQFSDGCERNVTALVEWTSSDDAIATVSSGEVAAVAPGAATITASWLDVDGMATITVE
jgi:uncharacterized protein YjdB